MSEVRICPQCGKEFIQDKYKKKTYCGLKCSNAHNGMMRKLGGSKNKEKITDNRKRCADINRLAREAGMSYGQYVAKMGL